MLWCPCNRQECQDIELGMEGVHARAGPEWSPRWAALPEHAGAPAQSIRAPGRAGTAVPLTREESRRGGKLAENRDLVGHGVLGAHGEGTL